MPLKKKPDSANVYANIMEEIKVRIAAVDAGTSNQLKLPPPLVREFCFLQLRMICELIALGCLVAHGDLKQSNKLKKQYAADKIIEELGRLHNDFFPRAVKQGVDENGYKTLAAVPGQMTREELAHLYHQCGNVVHKGNINKLLKEQIPHRVHYPEITSKAQRIIDLLSVHTVAMLGYEQHFICVLRDKSKQFKVSVYTAVASGPPGPLR